MRSLLYVHCQDNNVTSATAVTAADALIIDLTHQENRPSVARHERARAIIQAAPEHLKIFILPNPLDSTLLDSDLGATLSARTDGILLPNTQGNIDVEHLSARLRVYEAYLGIADASIGIIPMLDTPSAVLAAAGLRPHPRISALIWMPFYPNPGCKAVRLTTEDGTYHDLQRHTRTTTLLAASHLGVPAINAPCSFGNDDAFRKDADNAKRDGFAAQIANTEKQIVQLNTVFQPDDGATM